MPFDSDVKDPPEPCPGEDGELGCRQEQPHVFGSFAWKQIQGDGGIPTPPVGNAAFPGDLGCVCSAWPGWLGVLVHTGAAGKKNQPEFPCAALLWGCAGKSALFEAILAISIRYRLVIEIFQIIY